MKLLKRILLALGALLLVYVISYLWRTLPIISGYGAKNMCSCVMVAGRNPDDVIKNELGRFPLSLGTYTVSFSDSSATASVFGVARHKAIYRKGLGCTLISGIDEASLRAQRMHLAQPPTGRPGHDRVAGGQQASRFGYRRV